MKSSEIHRRYEWNPLKSNFWVKFVPLRWNPHGCHSIWESPTNTTLHIFFDAEKTPLVTFHFSMDLSSLTSDPCQCKLHCSSYCPGISTLKCTCSSLSFACFSCKLRSSWASCGFHGAHRKTTERRSWQRLITISTLSICWLYRLYIPLF